MDYKIVELKEKTVVGVSATSSNSDPQMGEIIGGLWEKLYSGGVTETIKNKVNDFAIGLYSDYEGDNYQILAGHEVSSAENSELTTKVVPAGRYAKFSLVGKMDTVVGEAWGEIWKTDLDRTFTGDFEEYLNADFENAKIDIYIAIK